MALVTIKTPWGYKTYDPNPPAAARLGSNPFDKVKTQARQEASLQRELSWGDLSSARQQANALQQNPSGLAPNELKVANYKQQQAPSGPQFPQLQFPQLQSGSISGNNPSGSGFSAGGQLQFPDYQGIQSLSSQQQTALSPGQVSGQPQQTNLTAEFYKPLQDLDAEATNYREDLRNNTGRIAGQVAQATGDFLGELYNQSDVDLARRGVADSGVENQQRQQARDTAMRAAAKQLGDVQLGQQQQLGGAISAALPIRSATPQLALQEKGIGLQSQIASNQAAQQNLTNNMAIQNQAFQQYMALLNATRTSPTYTGFNF